jgi:predicted aldo/keto reductase-like oxidoreductase
MIERRKFLKQAAAATALAAARKPGFGQTSLSAVAAQTPAPFVAEVHGIGRRTLGRTGAQVSIIGIGGHHIGRPNVSEAESIRIIRTALDAGVNFLDNAWDYNNGVSEERMGKALGEGYRQKAFLMTKIDGRTAAAARQQLEQSLTRLKTDHIDLLQLHEIIRPGDPEEAFKPGNVIDVLQQARKEGKIRFIGFTGHKSPQIHLHMIEVADKHGFTFDTVQMPVNLLDEHYDSFAQKVIPVAQKHHMGILGMKPLGDGLVLSSEIVTAVEGLHYAMSVPVTVTITGCDSMKVLDQALSLARNFKPMDAQQKMAVLEKAAPASTAGAFEQYKTTNNFDGTIKNPQWLG